MAEVKGYKVFRPDWTCRPNGSFKQYGCPGVFEDDVAIKVCDKGMHFCIKLADCFTYQPFDSEYHVCEVIALGDVEEDNDKCCTNKLEVVRELDWTEVLDIVNTGKGCTGDGNSGDGNSGNRNSGNRNSGYGNSGNRNSGDWNYSSYNSGCFNTEEHKIMLFDKPSDWTYQDWLNSEAHWILLGMPKAVTTWVYACDMTDEEKAAHPEHVTTGGYLKKLDEKDVAQDYWNSLSENQKQVILSLPNFDKEKFYQCTGICVDGDINA